MAANAAAYRPRRGSRFRNLRQRVLVYAGLCFYAFIAGLPVYWMFITTFKPDQDLYNLRAFPLFFNERGITFDHISLLFNRTGFTTWIRNTFVVSIAVVLITLLFSVPAGYALARLRFRGAESLTIAIFMTYLVPTTLLFLPLVKVISWLGLFDKLGSLIVAYPTFTIPFCTWLMAGFFKTIPFEIEEAAMVDGCSRLGAIRRVIPLTK
jgi:multiple sugar transport system permease protein